MQCGLHMFAANYLLIIRLSIAKEVVYLPAGSLTASWATLAVELLSGFMLGIASFLVVSVM
jgi:hypothetical protein